MFRAVNNAAGRLRWFFSFSLVSLLLGVSVASAQQAGNDYQLIKPPQPTSTGGKVEVIEFFSYACPHCASLAPELSQWLQKKPADVTFRRVPAIFQESWIPLARLYYTLEAMNLVDKLHHEAFNAIHKQKVRLQDPKTLFDWAASKGVDRQKFTDAYNSFGVQSQAKQAAEITRRYNIPFTPAVVVDGRYLTGPSMTSPGSSVDYGRFFRVLDQMIAGARKQTASK